MMENKAAARRYVNSKTTVWWDINGCPVPDGYEARLVGPCIDRALQNLGYAGPLSITAIGNLKHTPDRVVRELSSTGIVVKHVSCGASSIFALLDAWEDHNRPPATFMLISDDSRVWHLLSDSLYFLQKEGYNILLAYRHLPPPGKASDLIDSFQGWLWESLLADDNNTPVKRRQLLQRSSCFSCTLCHVAFQSHTNFTTHLKGEKHELNEYLLGPDSPYLEENVATTMTKQLKRTLKNVVVEPGADSSPPKHKAMVWWDIDRCPVPRGCDASLVGPRIESAFKNIGYSGPLTITAIGSLSHSSPRVLRAISSSGIVVKHVPFCGASIIEDVLTWVARNPPPATIMLLSSSSLLKCMSPALSSLQEKRYNILVAFPRTLPEEASDLNRYVGCFWETLLPDNEPETRRQTDGLSDCFICTTCDLSYQSFKSFGIHMRGEEHEMRAFRTCYYYLNQEPGSGTRYSPAVKKLSKEGLNISRFLVKLMRKFKKSNLNKQVYEAGVVGSSRLTTTMVKKQSKRKLKKRRIE